MVKNDSKKRGFTLIEILIAMVILSLFFVAAAKILTVKPRRQYVSSVHGLYECYYKDNKVMYHEVEEKYDKAPKASGKDYCEFKPSRNVAFYNIIVVPKGDPDTVYTDIQPAINKNFMKLYPGKSIISSNDDEDFINYASDDDRTDDVTTMTRSELGAYLEYTDTKSKIKDDLSNDTYKSGAIILKW